MFNFQIIHPPKTFIIQEKIISKIFNEIQKLEINNHYGILNIVFLPDNEIQSLNNQYRNIDTSTDVLSFHYFDDFSCITKKEVAGEIILSEEKIVTQGKQYKLGSELECYKLIIHSVFHILGYDHEKNDDFTIMKQKEDFIWDKIFNN